MNQLLTIPFSYSVITGISLIWTLIWKGIGLWYAAKKEDKVWFIVFLVLNLFGIPEIIYLFLKTDFFKKLDKKITKKAKK